METNYLALRSILLAGLAFASSIAVAEWRGVDLSYVNELEDCGAIFRESGEPADPYLIFRNAGANLVRLRLWHSPDWTAYSNLNDVKKSIRRARRYNLDVYLDFHYSDDWAHPGKQLRPAAWKDTVTTAELAARLHQYTLTVLEELEQEDLLPDIVSTGNEINTDLLIDVDVAEDAPINWPRNSVLLNAALDAAGTVSRRNNGKPRIMLHVAQPENVERFFDQGLEAGLGDFDIIGLSYYPKWSSIAFSDMPQVLQTFKSKYGKDVAIVETAYPWTLDGNDEASNLLGEDSLVPGYPASADGQRQYLEDLQSLVTSSGGLGVVYWEPAWISSSCETRWGKGSHWENAALFDFDGNLLPGAQFLLDR